MAKNDLPPMALVTVEGKGSAPTLDSAADQLGVHAEDIDQGFGVVPVDLKRGLFSVRVRADRLPADFNKREPYSGPFSDPPIATFGTIQDTGKPKK